MINSFVGNNKLYQQMINIIKISSLLGTAKVYFRLNELTDQSKKTDKQGSPEIKNFYLVNFNYIAI